MKLRYLIVGLILLCFVTRPAVASDSSVATDQTARLWRLAAKEQMALEQRGVVLSDPALSRYLQGVVERLWKQVPTSLSTPTVKVIVDTQIDAYAYPNGVCFLSTGMLDVLKNESQLAMILAHEMVHYTRQHTAALYNHFHKTVPQADMPAADRNKAAAQMTVKQKIDAAEAQADSEGLVIFSAAGYCQSEILKLMSNLVLATSDRTGPESVSELKRRAAFFTEQVAQNRQKTPCEVSTDAALDYLDRVAPALMANSQCALRYGNWDLANKCISKLLVSEPQSARAHYLQGEALRRQHRGDQNNLCIGSYEKALKIDPSFPLAHRALGEWYYRAGRHQKAKPYFEAFLSLAPQDHAREYIKGYLRQCQN